jgi:predicted enzyme related to lactoylglutathione lyase
LKIKLTSVLVNDQSKALQFYTETLGFVKKNDVSMGQYRWLTVTSPDEPNDLELLLEPNAHPAAKPYQAALYADGIPCTMFFVDDIQREYERLTGLGVTFRTGPTKAGPVTIAILDDTCGNYIQIVQR